MPMQRFDPRDYPLASTEPAYLGDAGAWIEHIPFALALMAMARPKVLVELGAHWGDSYMAFCQAGKQLGLHDAGLKCSAVDTWQGDQQAGFYGGQVLASLRQNHDGPYGAFSTLLQMTFDEAVARFDDGTVDLLHIDGLHTYEAVKHDFETWLPKLSPRGVVLFHDTAVRLPGYGVGQLWSELSVRYPGYEFPYGNGLGVLAVGGEVPSEVTGFIDLAREQSAEVNEYFGRLGSGIKYRMMFETLGRRVVMAQGLLNQWWQALGVQVNPGTEAGFLYGAPWTYGDRFLAELQQLANADLQFRKEQAAPRHGVMRM
jgi:O-antigen biosynthesis protein